MLLATVFLMAVLLDPGHVPQAGGLIFWLLSCYLIWTGFLAAIAWRNWWWDFRLARPAHAIDMAVFISGVLLTEAGHSYSSSPFIGFTVFLLITAMARWGKQAVVLTGIVLVASYTLAGVAMLAAGGAIDGYQFARRIANMIALALMMAWFGADVRGPLIEPMPEPDGIPGKRTDRLLACAVAFARETFQARGVAIALIDQDGAGYDLACETDGKLCRQRIVPGPFTDDLGADTDAMLFDIAHQRRIAADSDRQLRADHGPFVLALADLCQIQSGIVARVPCARGECLLLVWGLPVASIDDLPVIRALAREVGLALDREEMAVLAQSLAIGHVRSALARDLHDSAAQFLAGTLFRLEALRRWIREGRDPETEILAMRASLRQEQIQLRSMIERLRLGLETARSIDIVTELDTLMREIGAHWHIATSVDGASRPLPVSIDLAHELRLLVREAVANAVRHGQCSRVDLVIEQAPDGTLQVSIDDNGKGFDADDHNVYPRSISERIAALGGHLHVDSCAAGVRLDIALPLAIAA
jgi:signal transduction histidine kinase